MRLTRRIACLLSFCLAVLGAVPGTGSARNEILSRAGVLPSVYVDAAGTGHIVWAGPAPDGGEQLNYCRLRRGATTCDPGTGQIPLDPNRTSESDSLTIFGYGQSLVILDHLSSNSATATPDGSTTEDPVVSYISTDGGATWTGPGTSGAAFDVDGPSLSFGTDASPRFAFASSDYTNGVSVRDIVPGGYTPATKAAYLQSDASGAVSGGTVPGVTSDQGEPVAYWLQSSGNEPLGSDLAFRRWTGVEPFDDVKTWGPTTVLHAAEATLVGGPHGLLNFNYIGRDDNGRFSGLVVQHVTGPDASGLSSAGTPTTVDDQGSLVGSQALDAHQRGTAFLQAAGGSVTAVYSKSIGPYLPNVYVKTSPDGSNWSAPAKLLIPTPPSGGIQAAETADGGGFAVVGGPDTGPHPGGEVEVASFGPETPTGQPGIDGVPGGGIAPGSSSGDGSSGCSAITFGAVRITPYKGAGCFLPAGPSYPAGSLVSAGDLDINGLHVTPDPMKTIVVNAQHGTIHSTGPVTVTAEQSGVDPVVLYHGTLDNVATLAAHHLTGNELFHFPGTGVRVEGFPVHGSIDVMLAAGPSASGAAHATTASVPGGGFSIPLALDLPSWADGYTAAVTLTGANGAGLTVSSLHLHVPDIPLGFLELRNVHADYAPSSQTWTGGATLDIPEGGDFSISLSVTFTNGKLTQAEVVVSEQPGIAVATDVYLHQVSGGFGTDPFSLNLGAEVGLYDGAGFPVDVEGELSASFGSQVILSARGDLVVIGADIASATATIGFNPFSFDIGADVNILDVITGNLMFFIHPGQTPSFEGEGKISFLGVTVDGLISSQAIAGCAAAGSDALKAHIGVAYGWSTHDLEPDVGLGGCDIGEEVASVLEQVRQRVAGRVIAHAADAGFAVAPHTPFTDIRVKSATGTPSVTVRSPSGQVFTPVPITVVDGKPSVSDAPAVSLSVAAGTTVVMLTDPAAGQWTVTPTADSPAITNVETAAGVTPPKVTAHLMHGRRSRGMTLAYSLTNRPGATVTFTETGRGVEHELGGQRYGGPGRISFTPAPGPGGRRSIYALVSDLGVPQSRVLVATFTAPRPPRLIAVKHLKIAVRSRTFRISFDPLAAATGYVVRVTLADGRVLGYTLSDRAHALTVGGIGRRDSVRVTVTARGPLGLATRSAQAVGAYPRATPPHQRHPHHDTRSGRS